MKRAIGYATILAFALLMAACSASQVPPGLALVGNVPNPSAGVLSAMCAPHYDAATKTTLCDANSCLNYNLIGAACANGLPVQGLIGMQAMGIFCPANGYPQKVTFTPIQVVPACFPSAPAPLIAK